MVVVQISKTVFQPTHPHGCDGPIQPQNRLFQPTHPHGVRRDPSSHKRPKFQPHPHGAAHSFPLLPFLPCFNPRPHGCDVRALSRRSNMFQPTHPRGATPYMARDLNWLPVSPHPHGVRLYHPERRRIVDLFQPRTRTGCANMEGCLMGNKSFNPHRTGRDILHIQSLLPCMFQPTHPHGATK